jgi:hypothetical protein
MMKLQKTCVGIVVAALGLRCAAHTQATQRTVHATRVSQIELELNLATDAFRKSDISKMNAAFARAYSHADDDVDLINLVALTEAGSHVEMKSMRQPVSSLSGSRLFSESIISLS